EERVGIYGKPAALVLAPVEQHRPPLFPRDELFLRPLNRECERQVESRDHEVVEQEEIALFSRVAVVLVSEAVLPRSADAPCGELVDISVGRVLYRRLTLHGEREAFQIFLVRELPQSSAKGNDISIREAHEIIGLEETVIDEKF